MLAEEDEAEADADSSEICVRVSQFIALLSATVYSGTSMPAEDSSSSSSAAT